MSENYDSEKILYAITSAITTKNIEVLQRIQGYLEQNKLEGILLDLPSEYYEDYHFMLRKESIKREVQDRDEGIGER